MLEAESRTPSDAAITATVKAVSSDYIQETWHKALERRASDPEGAITAARTLLESVCKHILDPDWTAGALVSRTPDGLYTVLDVKRIRASPREVEQLVRSTAEQDGRNIPVYMEQEPGSSGVPSPN
jgi:phage terminase large subunit-like protein